MLVFRRRLRRVRRVRIFISFDTNHAKWIDHGKVLHKAKSVQDKYTETMTFPGLRYRFRVHEREPEIAFIDKAELVITLNNGNIFSIISKNPALGECDGQYVKLYWGQSVEFEFTLPEGTDRKAVIESILNLTGYYEPYSTELAKKNKMVTNIVSRSADYCPAR